MRAKPLAVFRVAVADATVPDPQTPVPWRLATGLWLLASVTPPTPDIFLSP